MSWFALYVKPRHEKNVALTLTGKGYDTFLPTHIKRHPSGKHFDLPLFPGYVFCRFDLRQTLPVLSTPGVFLIVGNGPEPQPVSEEELEAVKRFIAPGLTPVPWPYISPGEEVVLETGSLRGLKGVIVDASDEKWLVISVHLLQRSLAIKVDRTAFPVRRQAKDALLARSA